jgi:hypothetical protein
VINEANSTRIAGNGMLTRFTVSTLNGGGSSNTVTYSVRVNGVSVATLTIAAGQTLVQAQNFGARVQLGDRVSVQQTTTNILGSSYYIGMLWIGNL